MTRSVTPPPLPRQLKYAHFEAQKVGLHTAQFDRDRLEDARKQALAWIGDNPDAEVVSIDSCFGHMLAIVTVWYR
ncbi:MAG: hypothetical protein ACQCXQ_09560 [Verrucomicrobiales bacterium]